MGTNEKKADWNSLFEFYTQTIERFRAVGVHSAATGGIACVFYGYVSVTKDCDLVLVPNKAEQAREILARTQFEGASCGYNGPHGAPLDDRWLNGGWSSHVRFGRREDDCPRMDFFSHPPRLVSWECDKENSLCVGREALALMKRTQRSGKDWDAVNLIGTQMVVAEGNPRGWLYIYDAGSAEQAVSCGSVISQDIIEQRPALELVSLGKLDEAQAIFSAEQDFWRNLDRKRMQVYVAAWREYGKRVSQGVDFGATFRDQHDEMLLIASECLPQQPLSSESLVGLAAACLGNVSKARGISEEMFSGDIKQAAGVEEGLKP